METNEYEGIEKLINISYIRPEISDVHKKALHQRVLAQRHEALASKGSTLSLRPSWRLASGILVLLCLSILAIGPTTVWAQLAKWLGYTPSAGLVSDPSSVMTLVEPVHLVTQEYSVIIPDATLSSDRTIINYLVFQSGSSQPQDFRQCTELSYLTIPGSADEYREISKGIFDALPKGTTTAILNIPCVTRTSTSNTKSIALEFMPSAEEVVSAETEVGQVLVTEGLSGTVRIAQVFFEQNDMVIVTELLSREGVDDYFHISSLPLILDANGKLVAYESPLEMDVIEGHQNTPLNYNFKFTAEGVKFPIKIQFSIRLTEESTNDPYLGVQEEWSTLWAPISTDFSRESGICVNESKISELPSSPTLTNSVYLVYKPDGEWVMLNESEIASVIAKNAIGVRISPDRTMAAIMYPNRIEIKHLGDENEISILGSYSGPAFWNKTSNLVVLQSGSTIFVLTVEGKETATFQIPEGSLLAGWSASSESILYGTPEVSGKGYLLRSITLKDQVSRDLFYLDHSAGKNINLNISPDGKWVAYRGDKQATLIVKEIDTGEVRTIMDASTTLIDPAATDNFFWTNDSSSFLVEIKLPNEQEFTPYFVDIEGCNVKSIPDFPGKIQDVYINPESN